MDLLRPKKDRALYKLPVEEIYGDLLVIQKQAFYQDLEYYLESERTNAIMALKTKDSPEARAKWKFIDKIFNRIETIRREGTNISSK